jgi:hypothetical protein
MIARRLIPYLMAALILGAAAAYPAASQETPTPLEVSEKFWFFGLVPVDATVAHHFILTNPHADTVHIIKLIPGCDCTHLPPTPIAVPPKGTRLLRVEFDSKTYFGEINRDVHIVTDFSPNPEMDLYFGTYIGPPLETIRIAPPSLLFIRGVDEQSIEITNLSSEITKFRMIVDNDSALAVSPEHFTLAKGDVEKVTIRPRFENVPAGGYHSCVIMEAVRKDVIRASVPVKLNKY